jgi:hypothetical protein
VGPDSWASSQLAHASSSAHLEQAGVLVNDQASKNIACTPLPVVNDIHKDINAVKLPAIVGIGRVDLEDM